MSRRRSLLKDKNDLNSFRHHRDRHLGFCVSNEYYQQTPFFFTRECSQLNLVGMYQGSSAFLILNGPSLVNGDYDLSKLKKPGVITYGVNNGPSTFRPTFWSCVDDPQRFLKSIWLDPAITKFIPHAHAEKSIFDNDTWKEMKQDGKSVLVGDCPNCIYFHRNEKFEASRWLFEDKINWGNSGDNGGGRSVMLPALRILFLLGFRKVYLLGADFTMSEDYAYHFDEQREKGAVKCNMSTYKKMKDEYFPSLKPYFKEEGFEVYNCYADSGLKDVFDYVSFNDAIEEATGKLGLVENERTWGMYCKPGDKDKTIVEPDKTNKPHLKNLKHRDNLISASRNMNVNNEKVCKTIASQEPAVRKTIVSQEPVVRTTVIENPEISTKNYKVLSVKNPVDEIERNVKIEPVSTKAVNVTPMVEKIEEIPQTPQPINQISKERKLIKHLPFRS